MFRVRIKSTIPPTGSAKRRVAYFRGLDDGDAVESVGKIIFGIGTLTRPFSSFSELGENAHYIVSDCRFPVIEYFLGPIALHKIKVTRGASRYRDKI